jgi:hypothetical protein
MLDFLGTGIVSPFQLDQSADVIHKSGLDLLNADIQELLGIIGPTAETEGELPWRTSLGSRLHALKHLPVGEEATKALAIEMTSETLRGNESRARFSRARVSSEKSRLKIFLTYKPVGYNTTKAGDVIVNVER